MPDDIFDTTRWPEIPDDVQGSLRECLLGMQRAIDERLNGTVNISGDLNVGGYVVLQGPNRVKSFVES